MVEFKIHFDRLPTGIKTQAVQTHGTAEALKMQLASIGADANSNAEESDAKLNEVREQEEARQQELAQRAAAQHAELTKQTALAQATSDSIQSVARALTDLNQRVDAQQQHVENVALKFAESIAATLFQNDADLVAERLQTQVKLALDQLATEKSVSIIVHPDCLGVVRKQFETIDIPSAVTFLSNEQMRQGDCIVESDSLGLVARLDIQLERIRESVLESIQNGDV